MKYACQEAGDSLTGKYPPTTMIKMETRLGDNKPFVIGLTGTIGTGKSLVLSMLRHLGALTLDADWLVQLSYQKGRTGYDAVLAQFGEEILTSESEIDTDRLGKLVFGDETLLHKLEMLIHPIVLASINEVLQKPPLPIIAVEAIKLFESGLANICDQIWVVNASKEVVLKRLRDKRGLQADEVEERLRHQTGITERINQADVIVQNDQNANTLWNTIAAEWKYLSEKNSRFTQAAALSDGLLSIFKKSLLLPGNKSVEKVISQFQRGKINFLKKNFERTNEYSEDFFLMLCEYPTWLFSIDQQMDALFISSMKRRETEIIAESSLENLSETEILHILSIIEDYSRLQLHERIIFPYKGISSVLERSGYLKISAGESMQEEAGNLGEYNIYTRSLSPIFGVNE